MQAAITMCAILEILIRFASFRTGLNFEQESPDADKVVRRKTRSNSRKMLGNYEDFR